MKVLKCITALVASLLICANANTQSLLTSSNGLAAGKALLSLYTQYKADGKLDLSKANNITNIVNLITNVKGLKSGSTSANTPSSFISSLISGSNNLVTKNNANSVLGALGSISNLDTSSIASSVASSALSSVLSKKSNNTTTSSAASTAGSVLTKLFGSLK